ncbi:hypothetical protein BS50DRAFT_248642 [Corynespora cassiicola Philippines]|uniref:Uncharacterized protein n=1 Tax=Corynespora cassiicola Philippines TaxID=1448308 RepID=A0A2T2P3V4_CORCC|nr:hypothetical protein BS50DRAFT_248642 [Corynespora cassiicola Philippines]
MALYWQEENEAGLNREDSVERMAVQRMDKGKGMTGKRCLTECTMKRNEGEKAGLLYVGDLSVCSDSHGTVSTYSQDIGCLPCRYAAGTHAMAREQFPMHSAITSFAVFFLMVQFFWLKLDDYWMMQRSAEFFRPANSSTESPQRGSCRSLEAKWRHGDGRHWHHCAWGMSRRSLPPPHHTSERPGGGKERLERLR